MMYHGIEIFFQNLGDADSIFIRHWDNGTLTNILIDGGRKGDAEAVFSFLRERARETRQPTIHHLVCSHAHEDHAGGLLELVQNYEIDVEAAWVHDTRTDRALLKSSSVQMMQAVGARDFLRKIAAAENLRRKLLETLEARNIPIFEPFAGRQVGPLFVLGPSVDFFSQQAQRLMDAETLKALNRILKQQVVDGLFEKRAEKEDEEKELGGDPTSPENEVSTVMALIWDSRVYLFTADVGCEGLESARVNPWNLSTHKLRWMQIPHHGSRRNMNHDLINHFSPTTSFISCAGTVKHPSRKLVNALKGASSTVFSTHYSVGSNSWLRHHSGSVPNLSTSPAVSLYNKPTQS